MVGAETLAMKAARLIAFCWLAKCLGFKATTTTEKILAGCLRNTLNTLFHFDGLSNG